MHKFKLAFCSFALIAGFFSAKAQELNATVNVLSPNVQMTNKEVFTTLETALREFINAYQWTNLQYEIEERINCSFIITVNKYSNNTMSGTMQVQYSRPVYNSDYASPVLNFVDNDVSFSYVINQPLEYRKNTHTDNLTSLIAFYSNLIIGLDKATMQMNGGLPYFKQMQNIVSNAQSDGSAAGWRSFDGNKARYWLSDNINSPAFDPIIKGLYNYHRLGMDVMYDPSQQQKAKILMRDVLMSYQNVFQKRPNALLLNSWFDAKSDEIVNIFKDGPQVDVNQLVETLKKIDAGRTNKYETILER